MWTAGDLCLLKSCSPEEITRTTEPSLSNLVFLVKKKMCGEERGCIFFMFAVSYPSSTLPGCTNPNNAQTFLVMRRPSTFFRLSNTNLKCCLVEWRTQRISVLDPFSVRAHDSVWTRNLHPRQQSGFHHRVIAVKPLLTGWCGSQGLVKCNVPRDPVLAIALLHWNSSFFFH